MKARSTIWADAPVLAIPDMPAIFSDSEDLWLAYETAAESHGEQYAVIRFDKVIDHRQSPINDEGLGEHPYAAAGLKCYSFNEVTNSKETKRWNALGARHWVVTFKDGTLDIIAYSATIVRDDINATNAVNALLSVLGRMQEDACKHKT